MVPNPTDPLEGVNTSGWERVEIPRIDVEAPDTNDRYWNWETTEVEILKLVPPPPPAAIQERPDPVEERTEPAVPTLLLLSKSPPVILADP